MADTESTKGFLSTALNTGKYCDLEIRCKDTVLRVHRVIVCSQSKPLAAFLDNDCLEAATGIIDLPDDDPEIISLMVEFLYKSSYTISPNKKIQNLESPTNPAKRRKVSTTTSSSSAAKKTKDEDQPVTPQSMIVHVRTYIIGDKYDIPALKEFALHQWVEVAKIHWKTPSFNESLPLLYENTMPKDRNLKDAMVDTANYHRTALLQSPDFLNMLEICPAFSIDMLKYATRYPETHRMAYYCLNCLKTYECSECTHIIFYRISEDRKGAYQEYYEAICSLIGCEHRVKYDAMVCNNCDDSDIREIFMPFKFIC